MNGTEKVVRHLEMIQTIIRRMAINSFILKGVSVVFVITTQVLFVSLFLSAFQKDSLVPDGAFFVLMMAGGMVLFLTIGFWILDGFFLRKERLFQYHYDAIRKQDDTDFNMNVSIHKTMPKCSWRSVVFSATLLIFYFIEILFISFLPAMFFVAFLS